MGLRLFFLPNFPGATFIPDSRVGNFNKVCLILNLFMGVKVFSLGRWYIKFYFDHIWIFMVKMGHLCLHSHWMTLGLLMIRSYIEKSIQSAMLCWPKGSLISESFSISKLMCQITVLNVIHLKRIYSGQWFGIISGVKNYLRLMSNPLDKLKPNTRIMFYKQQFLGLI